MQYSIEVNNQVEIFDLNKLAKQASGAVLLRVKNTVVLATVAREDTQVEEDFLPLTVQYIEKLTPLVKFLAVTLSARQSQANLKR